MLLVWRARGPSMPFAVDPQDKGKLGNSVNQHDRTF